MNFNVDRIAVLAGLAASGKPEVIREGAEPAPVAAAPSAKPAAPAPMKKAAPAPAKAAAPAEKMEEEDHEGYMAEKMEDEANEMYHDSMGGMSYGDDVIYEIDETQLMEALVDMREARLEESRVRTAIREELQDILNTKEAGSRWLYGNRQPTKSGAGKISRGFLGPGFR